MAISPWDDPDLKTGGDYFKFENPGDTIVGTLVSVGIHTWDDGSKSPQLRLQTEDGEKVVTAGQIRLKIALTEKRPEVGDKIKITYEGMEKRAGGKTIKNFDVQVQKGAGAPKASDGLDPDILKAMQDKLGATPAPF